LSLPTSVTWPTLPAFLQLDAGAGLAPHAVNARPNTRTTPKLRNRTGGFVIRPPLDRVANLAPRFRAIVTLKYLRSLTISTAGAVRRRSSARRRRAGRLQPAGGSG